MIKVIRFLIVLSMASLVIGAFLSFDRPLDVDLPFDQAPPTWVWATLAFVAVFLAAGATSVGVFRFRRWARVLGLAVSICGAGVVWLIVGSPLAGALSSLTVVLFSVSALAWLASITLSYHSTAAPHFRA
jgi:hypothetical protein